MTTGIWDGGSFTAQDRHPIAANEMARRYCGLSFDTSAPAPNTTTNTYIAATAATAMPGTSTQYMRG